MPVELDLSTPPAWLEMPDPEIDPQKVQLWTVTGHWATKKRRWWQRQSKIERYDVWTALYPTSEEAEAHANSEPGWIWDGEPAHPQTLESALREARIEGISGVQIVAYRNGNWVTVREFPADVPMGAQ